MEENAYKKAYDIKMTKARRLRDIEDMKSYSLKNDHEIISSLFTPAYSGGMPELKKGHFADMILILAKDVRSFIEAEIKEYEEDIRKLDEEFQSL